MNPRLSEKGEIFMDQDLDKVLGSIRVNNDIVRTNDAALSRLFTPSTKKRKRYVIKAREAVLLGTAATSLAVALVGCNATPKVEDNPAAENTQLADDADTGALEGEGEEFSFVLPADSLDGVLGKIGVTNDMKTPEQVAAELNEQYGDTYTGPTYTPTGGGDTWASEQDYQEAKDAGLLDAEAGAETVTITGDAYIAPDGSAWTSEEEYQKYMQGQNGETIITTDSGWTAPDGSVWTSEEEYNKYVQSNNGTVVTPGSGEIVEQGEGYRAPDGTYWTSEDEYNAFISGSHATTNEGETYETTETVERDEYGGYYQDGYYWIDGAVYESQQDYLNLQSGYQSANPADTNGNYEEDYGEDLGASDYYTAPDGTTWASESDYQDYLNAESATTTYAETGENEITYTDDDTYTEDSNYYLAPDGTYWASEEEYNWFVNSQVAETSYEGDAAVFDTIPEGEATVTEETTGEDLSGSIEDFYTAPDGTVWASEEEYHLYMDSLQATSELEDEGKTY